jgi:hypothetical protein
MEDISQASFDHIIQHISQEIAAHPGAKQVRQLTNALDQVVEAKELYIKITASAGTKADTEEFSPKEYPKSNVLSIGDPVRTSYGVGTVLNIFGKTALIKYPNGDWTIHPINCIAKILEVGMF